MTAKQTATELSRRYQYSHVCIANWHNTAGVHTYTIWYENYPALKAFHVITMFELQVLLLYNMLLAMES